MGRRPAPAGIELFEDTIVEEGTQLPSFLRGFSHRIVDDIPSRPTQFVATSLLTGGQGEVELKLALNRLDTDEILFTRTRRVNFPGPLSEYRLTIWVVLREGFPIDGDYDVTVEADGELIARRRLNVTIQEDYL